jgi:hypothetical protein
MKNLERCQEICFKLEKISEALMEESIELKDDDIADLAAILGVIGNGYLIQRDRFVIREFFDMYSAKKIIEAMNRKNFGDLSEDGFNPDDPITNG